MEVSFNPVSDLQMSLLQKHELPLMKEQNIRSYISALLSFPLLRWVPVCASLHFGLKCLSAYLITFYKVSIVSVIKWRVSRPLKDSLPYWAELNHQCTVATTRVLSCFKIAWTPKFVLRFFCDLEAWNSVAVTKLSVRSHSAMFYKLTVVCTCFFVKLLLPW